MKKTFLMFMVLLVLIGQVGIGSSYAEVAPNNESDFTTSPVNGGVEITGYSGTSKDVVIPEFIGQKQVVAIGIEAFNFKSLTSVSIPSGVITIDGWAFANNQLTSVTIPSGVITIGKYAFANNQFTSVTIPSSTTTLHEGSFFSNQLTSVSIPFGVITIGKSAFASNQLKSVEFMSSVTTIGDDIFAWQYTDERLNFQGWFTDEEHTIAWNNKVTTQMVLYSKWVSTLASITVTPTSVSLAAGKTQALGVKAAYSDGSEEEVTGKVTYSSSNIEVATVDAAGVVKAVGEGNATITVTYEGKSTEAEVAVTPAPAVLEAISVTPKELSLEAGKTQALGVNARYADKSEVEVTSEVTYSSSNNEVATVDAAGVVKALKAGAVEITLTFGGKTAVVGVTVIVTPTASPEPTTPAPAPTASPTPVPTPVSTPAPSTVPAVKQLVFNEKVNVETVLSSFGHEQQAPNVSYSDVPPTLWSAGVIKQAAHIGFVTGYPDGTFRPDKDVTRAEFATMIVKAFGLVSSTSASVFNDTAGHWAVSAIRTLQSFDIVQGYSNGNFRPDQKITRAEMVAILSRLTKYTPSEPKFSDVVPNSWASDAIGAFAAAGIVDGKGEGMFKPNDYGSRAEGVTIIIRLINQLLPKK